MMQELSEAPWRDGVRVRGAKSRPGNTAMLPRPFVARRRYTRNPDSDSLLKKAVGHMTIEI